MRRCLDKARTSHIDFPEAGWRSLEPTGELLNVSIDLNNLALARFSA